jgi:NAD-dependent dihydropyrimidine dehydrogenase PreA subunit
MSVTLPCSPAAAPEFNRKEPPGGKTRIQDPFLRFGAMIAGEKGIMAIHPVIDLDNCIADQACLQYCTKDVYELDDDGKPLVAHPENCDGCEDCVTNCPTAVISLVE